MRRRPELMASTRGIMLVLVLLAVALPAAAQETLGVRAGVASTRMDFGRPWENVAFAPCPPDVECPGYPTDTTRSVTVGVDLGFPLRPDPLELRVGGSYVVKGGSGSGHAGDHEQIITGARSLRYFQLSSFLRARARGGGPFSRLSVSVLAGPWVAVQLSCGEEGKLVGSCASHSFADAGVAFGGGAEAALSRHLSLGVEVIYHVGLAYVWSDMTTRYVAVQAGVGVPVGQRAREK